MTIKTQSLIHATREFTVEKTRPSNTTAYTNEDVISEDDSSGTSWVFAGVVPADWAGGTILGNTNPVYATESDNYQGRLDWAALEDLGGRGQQWRRV